MPKPSEFELQLIQKITIAEYKLRAAKRQHAAACPAADPEMAGKCTCGAGDQNVAIDSALKELKIE